MNGKTAGIIGTGKNHRRRHTNPPTDITFPHNRILYKYAGYCMNMQK